MRLMWGRELMDETAPTWIIFVVRLGLFLVFLFLAYYAGQRKVERGIRAQLPHHSHRAVEGCLRCQIDKALDL